MVVPFLKTLMLPPLCLFLIYGAGLALRAWRPRLGRALCSGAIAAMFVLCTKAGAWLLVHPLENLESPLLSASAAGAQAIVVLGAGRLENSPEYGGKDIPDYIALARLRYSAKLHRETSLPVLVSGGNLAGVHREPFAAIMARALQEDFATPVEWIEDRSANTAENAEFSAQILKQAGIRRILLVTDAMHMRRSKTVFAKTGMEVVAAPTMFLGNHGLTFTDFLPGAEGLRRSHYAVYEWLGLAWYRLRYRVRFDPK